MNVVRRLAALIPILIVLLPAFNALHNLPPLAETLWGACDLTPQQFYQTNERSKIYSCPHEVCDGLADCSGGFDEHCTRLVPIELDHESLQRFACEFSVASFCRHEHERTVVTNELTLCGDEDSCEEHESNGNELAGVAILRWPFGCATPICVDNNGHGNVNDIPGIEMAAHLLCQQLGAATYHSYGAVVSPPGVWPSAIESRQMRCVGHEATVHQCLPTNPTITIECRQLLYIECSSACVFDVDNATSGMIESPAFPQFILPNLRCRWLLHMGNRTDIAYRGYIEVLNVYNRYVNRVEARDQPEMAWRLLRHSLNQQLVEVVGYFEPCAESFLILNYGLYRAIDEDTGVEVLRRNITRACSHLAQYRPFITTEPRLELFFRTAPYRGDLYGFKGFRLVYKAVSSSESEHFYHPPEGSNMGLISTIVAIIVLISLLILVAVIVVHRCRVARRRQVAILRIVHGSGQHNFGLIPDWDGRVPQVFKEQYMLNSLLMPARTKGSKQALDGEPLVNEMSKLDGILDSLREAHKQNGIYCDVCKQYIEHRAECCEHVRDAGADQYLPVVSIIRESSGSAAHAQPVLSLSSSMERLRRYSVGSLVPETFSWCSEESPMCLEVPAMSEIKRSYRARDDANVEVQLVLPSASERRYRREPMWRR